MIEEGFSEDNIIAAILGKSRIIEIYDEDKRCLISAIPARVIIEFIF